MTGLRFSVRLRVIGEDRPHQPLGSTRCARACGCTHTGLTPLLDPSSVFANSRLPDYFSSLSLLPQPSHRWCFVCDGFKVLGLGTLLPKLPEMIAFVGLWLRLTAPGARKNEECAILSCLLHGCLHPLTSRCMLPDSRVGGYLSWTILEWKQRKLQHLPTSFKRWAMLDTSQAGTYLQRWSFSGNPNGIPWW